jgi:beta-N-acetylhexosaminidase
MSFNPAKFLILGFKDHSLDSDFVKFIELNPPAGFLLLGENYKDEKQLRGLIFDLKAIAGANMLITVDQEPGRVQRFKDGFPLSKKPRHYLKPGNISEFRSWCIATAEKMAELGINVNLAPMVDLWLPEKDYPVLNDRSFGDDPDRVAEFAGILIEEFRKFHIWTCAKHFPGLGAAIGDPHEVLSTSNEKLERFLDYHWRPFKQVVSDEVAMVMTTHLLCPALDTQNCATYSSNVISHLRNTVGHQGLIISDDLYMAGAQSGRNAGQAACDSLYAGHNLLIISRDLEFQRQAISAIKKRFEEDEAFGKIASEYDKRLKALRDVR